MTVPKDVRWAFGNKTTFKRSTGCNIEDPENAVIERDKIVRKFKSIVEFHRLSSFNESKLTQLFGSEFSNRPYPDDYSQSVGSQEAAKLEDQQNIKLNDRKSGEKRLIKNTGLESTQETKNKITSPKVEGWIKERLLNKSQQTRILRYDFWKDDKNEN